MRTAAVALSLAIAPEAESASVNSSRELSAALGECVKAPAGLPGPEITVVFSWGHKFDPLAA